MEYTLVSLNPFSRSDAMTIQPVNPIGTSPVYDREMPTGVHIVEASLARHFSVVDTVRIRAGQRTLKSFSLSPVPPDSAQVVVYTIDASTAEVTLSGQGQLYIGQTPFSQAVVKGEYTLRVSRLQRSTDENSRILVASAPKFSHLARGFSPLQRMATFQRRSPHTLSQKVVLKLKTLP